MKKLVLKNGKVVSKTQKALLIAFPEDSKYNEYAVWFPKSKVEIEGDKMVIDIMSEEYQVVFQAPRKIKLEELAAEYKAEIIE